MGLLQDVLDLVSLNGGEAVPIEESLELSSSKIGGSPIEGNTEVIEETKESSTPYSIENEPNEQSS